MDAAIKKARVAISAVFFVSGAALGSWAPHIPVVKDRLQLSPSVLGWALLASACGAVLTMPFSGALIHRFGSRVTSVTGGLILSFILPLLVIAPSLPVLVSLLFCLGVFNGQMDVSMNAHSVLIQDRYDRPILSAVHGWWSIGGLCGGIGTAMALRFGVPPVVHMTITGGVLLTVLLASVRYLLPVSADANTEGAHFEIPRGPILLLGVLTFFAFLTEGALWDWAAVYMRDVLKTEYAQSAYGFGAFSLGVVAARFYGDHAIKLVGHTRVVAIGSFVSALGILLAISVHVPFVALLGFAIAGAGMANIIPIFFKSAGANPNLPTRTAMAMITTCGYTGLLAGPAVIGFVAEHIGLSSAFILMAALSVLIAMKAGVVARLEG